MTIKQNMTGPCFGQLQSEPSAKVVLSRIAFSPTAKPSLPGSAVSNLLNSSGSSLCKAANRMGWELLKAKKKKDNHWGSVPRKPHVDSPEGCFVLPGRPAAGGIDSPE